MLHQNGAVGINDSHYAVRFKLECFIVRAIFLGFLRHQSHVGHSAHSRGIKGTIGLAEIDHFLIDGGVSTLGHYRFGIFCFAIGAPHFSPVADHCGHGRINDNVAGYMQVGDALHRINHGKFWAMLIAGVNVFQYLLSLRARQ